MTTFYGAPAFSTLGYFVILFLFALIAVPLSYASRRRSFQDALHIGLGSLCLFSVAPRLLFFYLAFWILVYLLTIVATLNVRGLLAYAKTALPILIILSPMVYWKLDSLSFEWFLNINLHKLIWTLWEPAGEIDAIYFLVVPLGLSFSVFRAVDLFVEVLLGVTERPRLSNVLAYGLFAPIQIVGPIVQYRTVDKPIAEGAARNQLARWGAGQIVIGLGKVFILAWPLSWSADIVNVFDAQPLWVIWLSVVVFPLYLFLNFSGFTDLSIGSAAIFGHRLEPNFNAPLLRTSLQQFWNNWNMSLTKFAQRYIFVPLGGYRQKTQYFALFCTMMTIALWHDLSLALVIFGTLHGGAMILGRMIAARTDAVGDAGPPKGEVADTLWRGVGWFRTYMFIALTAPLLIVRESNIVPFYESLFGGR